jgi:hypothetical protein
MFVVGGISITKSLVSPVVKSRPQSWISKNLRKDSFWNELRAPVFFSGLKPWRTTVCASFRSICVVSKYWREQFLPFYCTQPNPPGFQNKRTESKMDVCRSSVRFVSLHYFSGHFYRIEADIPNRENTKIQKVQLIATGIADRSGTEPPLQNFCTISIFLKTIPQEDS